MLKRINRFIDENETYILFAIATILGIFFTVYYFLLDKIIAYGDAESHLNISKRVIDSITPGFGQLGGVWLPLPHILMLPFIYFDPLWRTGLAGSIVSGVSFVVASIFIYKLTFLFTKNKLASFVAFLVFALNPNILYLQATPMTELPLIAFFVLSTYFFFKFISNDQDLVALILAGFFGFCATLTRYDAWFLVLFEALALILFYLRKKGKKVELEGKLILFSSIAFFGCLLWLLWDFLILGDPMYFANSEFSAHTQQLAWIAKGELITYHNILLSVVYYLVTAMSNSGTIIFILSGIGLALFLVKNKIQNKLLFTLIIIVPFIFYIVSLYTGQAAIFIPQLTPKTFEWNLFNVRYGVMVIPAVAFMVGWLFFKVPKFLKVVLVLLISTQLVLFFGGFQPAITYQDGVIGLSREKRPDAENWLRANYDHGLVLIDDNARTVSLIRTNINMRDFIYIGNKPYWNQSLQEPEKYASWIVMENEDSVWTNIYDNPVTKEKLYKYFQKVYTSPSILIFKRNSTLAEK